MLQETIKDKNFVWDKYIASKLENFVVKISNNAITELKNNRKFLNNSEHTFLILQKEILDFKNKILIDGIGFFVIDGKCFTDFSKEELIEIYENICKILGTLYIQNDKNQKLVQVQDRGKSMKSGGRYHQTKEGGSYHTDGCHIFENPPDYVGLLCLNPAKNGGVSKFISAYTIHNKLQEDKNLLRILYEKFYMDKRNENQADETPTQFVPIFTYNNGKLNCRCCQRELIDSGHEKMNKPLTEYQKNALDNLDKLLANENLAVSYLLKKGDMMYSNNKWLIHDRTDFEDSDDENLKRALLRTWIREKVSN